MEDCWTRAARIMCLLPVVIASPAGAIASVYLFDIPEQGLASAIAAIGRQGKIDILYAPATLTGRRSAAVRGAMSAIAALRAALRGAPDLEVVATEEGALLVRPARIPPRGSMRRPEHGLSVPGRQDEPEPEAPDIVVTATRRATLLKRYPGTIRVLRGSQVEKQGRTSLGEAAALAPGLNLTETGAGQRRITMRGLHSAGENSVLLYLDETPLSGPSSATSDVSQMSPDIRLFDVDRVEILRGPQGTLFGSGAMGGAVRILFNQPDAKAFAANGAAGVSTIAGGGIGHIVRGTVNLPLVADALAVRASAYDERRSGHVDNVALGLRDIDSARTTGGRLAVRVMPADGFDLTATALVQRQRIADASTWYAALGRDRTDMAERLPFPNDLRVLSLVGHARIGGADLTGVVSSYRWDVTRTIDSTRTAIKAMQEATYCPLYTGVAACDDSQKAAYSRYLGSILPLVGIQPMRVDASTAELRVATPVEQPLSVTAGLFLERRSDASRSGTYLADSATGEPLTPLVQNFLRTISVETRQSAIFADIAWRPAERVTLAAGARAYRYDKNSQAQVLQTSYVNGAVAGSLSEQATRSSGWTGRVNLSVDINADILAYAQMADGFRPGGVNTIPNLPAALVAFEADRVRAYEAGLRSSWLGGRLVANAAAYHIDWKNMQTSARIPSFLFVSNAGAARIMGVDIEVEAAVTEALRLRGALNLLSARLNSDQQNSVVAAPGLKGDRIPFEPSVTAAFSAEYRRRLGSGRTAFTSLDLAYVGTSWSDFRPTSDAYERMGDFATATLRAGLSWGRWTLQAHVANLFDAVGRQKVESSYGSEQLTTAIAPRTFGLELSWAIAGAEK